MQYLWLARLSPTVRIAVFCVRTLVRPFLRNVDLDFVGALFRTKQIHRAPHYSTPKRVSFFFWSLYLRISFARAFIDWKLRYNNSGVSHEYEIAVTCSCVHQSPGHCACRVQFSHQDSTQRFKAGSRKRLLRLPGSKVQLEWHKRAQTGCKWARDRLLNRVRLGIRAECCIATFSDQNQSTQRPKDYKIWTNRGHPRFYKNETAFLVTFSIQIPI